MPLLHEQLNAPIAVHDAFAFVADFGNAARWDPGVASSERADVGRLRDVPIGPGSTFRLLVRMGRRLAPMEYVVTTWDPPRRVVLRGRGSGVTAVDDIRFEAVPGGTRIDYAADIRLTGLMRLLEPFTGGAFATIARNARDGMQRALNARAEGRA